MCIGSLEKLWYTLIGTEPQFILLHLFLAAVSRQCGCFGKWKQTSHTSFYTVKLTHSTGGSRRKTRFWVEGGFKEKDARRWNSHDKEVYFNDQASRHTVSLDEVMKCVLYIMSYPPQASAGSLHDLSHISPLTRWPHQERNKNCAIRWHCVGCKAFDFCAAHLIIQC